jgi:protein DEK
LSKIKGDDELLKLIHRSMYRTPGKATVIKKNIRAFSGFPAGFDVKKSEDLFTRAFAATLNMVLDLFDLPRGVGEDGKKEAKVARLMAFMQSPVASGKKDVKAAAEEKREKGKEKRERLTSKKEKLAEKKAKGKGGTKKGASTSSSKKLPDDTAGIKKGAYWAFHQIPPTVCPYSYQKGLLPLTVCPYIAIYKTDTFLSQSKELQAMAQRQAELLAKLEKKAAAASPEPSPAKPKQARKAKESGDAPAAKKPKEAKEASEEEPAEKEEPDAPESKMPSDADLELAVKQLLKGADMESISMKKVRGDLEEKLGVPLTDKKAKIKEIVNEIIGA